MSHALYYPVTRFGLACILSLIITFTLFFLMQSLIVKTGFVDETSDPVRIVNYVREPIVEAVKQRERVPRPEFKNQPPVPRLQPPVVNQGTQIAVNEGTPDPIIDLPKGPVFGQATESDLVTLFKPPPAYPRNALAKGIEGYVIVEYTVTAIGTTRDIRVIESDPQGVFEEASIAAASRFKYQPRVIAGSSTEVTGVRNLFTFVLNQ